MKTSSLLRLAWLGGAFAGNAVKRRALFRRVSPIFYAILRALVPTAPKQIGFLSAPDLEDNSLAFFGTLIGYPRAHDYRLVWLVEDKANSERILEREFPNADLTNVTIVVKNSLCGFCLFLRCRYMFVTHGVYFFARSGYHQTICNLWHGMPIKTIGSYDGKSRRDSMFMHYSIATSEYFADLIANAFYLSRDRVLVTGLPRNEWLFVKEDKYLAFKEGRTKLAVWLPTYRRSYIGEYREDAGSSQIDPLDTEILNKLDEMLEGADVILMIKLHFMDIRNTQAWSSYKNIRIYTDSRFRSMGSNLYKLLACSDTLVTDFSSCAIDYILLNKPIGLFSPDKASYTRGFMPDVLSKIEAVAHELTSIEEFGAFLTDLPQGNRDACETENLCRMNLRRPTESILEAVGLSSICSIASPDERNRRSQSQKAIRG